MGYLAFPSSLIWCHHTVLAGLTVVADLFLGCIDFPQVGANTPSGQASRVELLETDDNGTVAAANMTSARNWTVSDVEVFGAYNGTESP